MVKNYPGSKGANGAWQQIISQVPRCQRFIELMAGSAVLSAKIKNVPERVVNDVDPTVINSISIPGVTKLNLDYSQVLDLYSYDRSNTVFYCDPPYLMSTRSHKKRLYKFDWGQADHERFLDLVTRYGGQVMVSHYPCSLYQDALKDWRQVPYRSMTRAGLRQELLFLNFDLPPLLADPSNVGENFTDRQRLKRKVNRLITRLDKEEPLERSAILSYVIAHYDYLIS